MTREQRFPQQRRVRVALLWMLLLAFTGALLGIGGDVIGDVRGATVDAVVVGIRTNVPGRRVYDVQLVTRSGRVCVTEVDSGSNPPPRNISVGATSRVHYSSHNTCAALSVRESTTSSPESWMVLAALVIAVCLFELWRLRRDSRRTSGSAM
jgi:hypothetical protein